KRDWSSDVCSSDLRFNWRTAKPLGPNTAPGCDEPTSRCQTSPSLWTRGGDQPVIPRVAVIRRPMAFPLTYHRIADPDLRLCSPRPSRSQAGLYGYTHCMVAIHAEPTCERLRYILGGDRPSQTAHLTVSPDRIHGRRLEIQQTKGGIPRVTPHKLTPVLPSLPPILYMIYRISVLSCS